MMKQLNQQSGFTLLELLMVVIIVGILATLALPAYIRASEKARTAEVTTVLGAMKNSAQRYCADSDGLIAPATFTDLDMDNPKNVVGLGMPDASATPNPPRWLWDATVGPGPGTIAVTGGSTTVIPVQGTAPLGVGTPGVVGVGCAAVGAPFTFEASIVRNTGPCAGSEVRYRTTNSAQPIEVAWSGQCA